ncbi:hypothetical protein [uncultured Desulfovibrio sp.]|uniref:hypothetical protein n=1 Tax=uncultured Desulfovibrio sp. TaxID=167968 RepID=UPI0003B63D6A|nr:hypothetical protein [uncultured Desulfovibrio sp.]
MKITIINDFHGSSVEVIPIESYTLESGQACAVLPYAEYQHARKVLCGMSNCNCMMPGNGLGYDGVRYILKFE